MLRNSVLDHNIQAADVLYSAVHALFLLLDFLVLLAFDKDTLYLSYDP